ncbi:unnamed protein product [Triticum turgidum subsp. durum]|uniref:Protein FAR1-RELATED SEQUENCE n=1 Tax=Triticum turgidum subsp. durum TaxID=4567 RepID=A0A9R0XT92_TRITD|nr:unnamed protein product [Triticum turgidum subsp. durum]
MPTLKDLLPRQAQLAVPFVLLPMDLQAGLRGLITQVSTFTDSKTKTRNISAGCTITKILNFLYDYYTGDRDGPTTPLEAASLAQASDDFVPRDPPRSTTKGRAKSRRYKSALELHPKKKNKCSQCQSTEHTAGVCPQRLL